jgi:hypothetical protein
LDKSRDWAVITDALCQVLSNPHLAERQPEFFAQLLYGLNRGLELLVLGQFSD